MPSPILDHGRSGTGGSGQMRSAGSVDMARKGLAWQLIVGERFAQAGLGAV
jgi:hypothetical protein